MLRNFNVNGSIHCASSSQSTVGSTRPALPTPPNTSRSSDTNSSAASLICFSCSRESERSPEVRSRTKSAPPLRSFKARPPKGITASTAWLSVSETPSRLAARAVCACNCSHAERWRSAMVTCARNESRAEGIAHVRSSTLRVSLECQRMPSQRNRGGPLGM